MRTYIKGALVICIGLMAAFYLYSCSSAEQTTAKIAFQQGDYKKAEIEFDKETKQNPENEEAWFYLGISRVQLNKADEAQQAMDQYRRIGKNTFRSELVGYWGDKYDEGYKNFELGEKSWKANNNDLAIKQYKAALNSFRLAQILLPESTVVKTNIDAINGRINTILLKPYLDKGIELEKAEDYAGAIDQYKIALEKVDKGSVNYEIVTYDIALADLKWGEKLRTANQDDPAYKTKYQEALPYLEELKDSKDKATKIQAYDLLVQVYANLGMNDKALEAMKIRDELKNQNK